MAYGAVLERRFTRKGIEGSNPSPSAIGWLHSHMTKTSDTCIGTKRMKLPCF